MIERFRTELEAAGGNFHEGREAVAELAGDGVSVTPTLAAIADTGTIVTSSLQNGGRMPGSGRSHCTSPWSRRRTWCPICPLH